MPVPAAVLSPLPRADRLEDLEHPIGYLDVSAPLGIVDVRTVSDDDFVPVSVVHPDRRGEIGYYRYNPAHACYWFPFLRPSEALVFETHESAAGAQHWSCPHASFSSPNAPLELGGERDSVEFRVLLGFAPEESS